MKLLPPGYTPTTLRVFFACLLIFNIFVTPIGALASNQRSEVKGQRSEKKDSTKASADDVFAKPLEAKTGSSLPAARPEPAPQPLAPPPIVSDVTATLAASFTNGVGGDVDSDGKADPGDTINYSITLTSSGAGATGLSLSNPLDSHTTLVGGSLNSTPVAFDQSVNTNEDTGISVIIQGQDPDGSNLTFNNIVGPSHGSLGVFSGPSCTSAGICSSSATYTPNADYNGADSFTFKANDGTANSNENGVVSITVNPVNDAPTFTVPGNPAAANEDAGAQTVSSYITNVRPGNTTDTLENGQTVNFVITNNTNPGLFLTAPALNVTGASYPKTATLTYTSAANQNGTATISYHAHDNGGTSPGVDTSTPDQTFTITVNAVNDPPVVVAPSAYVAQANMKITGLTGLLGNVNDNADNGVNGCVSTTFTVTAGSIAATTAHGGNISNVNLNTGTFDYDPPAGYTGADTFTYTVSDTGCPGVAVSTPATTVTINVSGPVIWFVDTTLGVAGTGRLTAPFNTLDAVTNSVTGKMGINANQRAFVFSGSNTAVGTTTTLAGNNSAATLALARVQAQWLIGQGTVASSFDSFFGITPPAGTIARPTLSNNPTTANGMRPNIRGTVTMKENTVVEGLNINTSAGGTKGLTASGLAANVSGSLLTIKDVSVTSAGGNAVDISAGSNTNNSVEYTTSDQTNSPNTITSTTGSALIVNTVSIGANGLTFKSITAAGSANGIFLSNTGNGFLNVYGDASNTAQGGNNTGGTISNTTGADGATSGIGVYLNNAKNITLRRMHLQGNSNFAIFGNNVTALKFEYNTVDGTNGSNVGFFEDAIQINGLFGTGATDNSFTNDVIKGGWRDNLHILNITATNASINTPDKVTITGCLIRDTNTGSNGNDNVHVRADGTGNIKADITNNTIAATNADHIQTITDETAKLQVVITGNTISGGGGGSALGEGITISGGTASPSDSTEIVRFNVSNNTMSGTIQGGAININEGSGNGNWQGQVSNNVIGVQANVCSGASQSSGIRLENHSKGSLTGILNANTIRQTCGAGGGISISAGDSTASGLGNGPLNATVTGNTVANPGGSFDHGIVMVAGNLTNNTNQVCYDLKNNTSEGSHVVGSSGFAYRTRQRFNATLFLPGYGGANNDATALKNYFIARPNTAVPGDGGDYSSSNTVGVAAPNGPGGGFVNTSPPGSQCTQPTVPLVGMLFNERVGGQQLAWAGGLLQNNGIDSLIALVDPKTDFASFAEARGTSDQLVPANTQAILLATVSAEASAIPAAPTRNVVTIAANSMKDIAGTVSSLIEPTVHAETQTKPAIRDRRTEIHSQKPENRNQRSDIRLNHAASLKLGAGSLKAFTIAAPFVPTPVGSFPINGTGTGAGFTLPASKTTTITFKATLNNPPNLSGVPPGTPQVSAQGTLTGSFIGNPIVTDNPAVGGTADPTVTPVDLFDTTTTLAAVPTAGSWNVGQSITFTATVAPNPANATVVTGTVVFKDNGTPISGCNGVAIASGQAQCMTTFGSGAHSVVAVYSGDGNYECCAAFNTSNTLAQGAVNQSGTATTVTSSLNPSFVTQSVTFTATVTSSTGFSGPPTGTVQFRDNLINLGSAQTLNGSGVATLTTSALVAGNHPITAVYSGDTNFTTSTGTLSAFGGQQGDPQVVAKSNTTTALLSNANPSKVNQNVTFTGTVTSQTAVTGPPAGTLTFKADGNPLTCSNGGTNVQTLSSGSATCQNATLASGAHVITADYAGDGTANGSATFNVSTGTLSPNQQVDKSDTTTALQSSQNPSTTGNAVTFTATVTSQSSVTGPPAGKAQFFDGASAITCTGGGQSGLSTGETLNGSGVATCTTSTLTTASHNITATYTGDGSANGSAAYNTSTSSILTQVVNPACSASVVVANTTDSGAGSLRQAIADVCAGGTITFDAVAFASPGPYTINLSDVASNELHITKSMTIMGPGANVLTVQRVSLATNNFRVFEIDSGKTVAISGMTIGNGSVVGAAGGAGANGSPAFGGAVLNAGTLTVTGVVVIGSQATGGAGGAGIAVAGGNGAGAFGGGIFNTGTLTLNGSTVSGNSVTGGAGGNSDTTNGNGGPAQGGGIYSTGTLTLTNSTIGGTVANSATGGNAGTGGAGGLAGSGDGGGIYDDATASPTTLAITGSTINGNTAAANGGGILIVGTTTNATVTITNSTISGNHANNDGGGISNTGATGTTTLTGVTVTANTCDNDNDTFGVGGGLNIASGTFILKNTIVAGNLKGSSILQVETATVVETVPGVLVPGNANVTVTAAGMNTSPKTISVALALNANEAAVATDIRAALTADPDVNGFFTVSGTNADVVLTARTVAANDTSMNIAIADNTSLGLTAEPTSADTTPGRPAHDIGGAGSVDATSSFNLIGDASSSGGLSEPNANNNFVGVSGVGIRHITTILNFTLADNGGPTKTHALVANSPALDNGDDFSVPVTMDQRGFVRPVDFVAGTGPGDESDIGAYEQQAQPVAPNKPDLDAASDTGVSNTDDVTADTSPTFTITGVVAGAFVELLRDDDGAGGNPPAVVASGTAVGASIQLTDPSVAGSPNPYLYTARQTVSGAPTSAESVALSVTIDTSTPAAPDAPDLDAASDTGISQTDNLTKDITPTFTINNVTSGLNVQLLRDTNPVPTGLVVVDSGNASGPSIQLTDPNAPQGSYVYTARQSNGVNSTSSATGLIVNVDTTPPAAPGPPDLQAGSDTFGVGGAGTNSDNITSAGSRVFDIPTTTNGVRVELYRDLTLAAFGTGNGGTLTLTDTSTPGDATYSYTARQVDDAGNFAASGGLNVNYDTTATAAGIPDLQAASDSGPSSTDNYTKAVSRSFDIPTTENGSLVELYRGATFIASTTGTGTTVTLTDNSSPGDGNYDYTSKQTDLAGNAASSSILTVTIDTTPNAPGTPNLQDASDTGSSNTDNRTGNATHSFDIASQSGDLVELLRDGSPVSSTTAAGASVTLSDSASLSDNVYHYTARQTDLAGNVATSAGTLDVTIDTTAPLVSSDTRASANPTSAASVDFTITFSEDVTGVDVADFVAVGSGGLTGASVTTVTPVNAKIYTVSVNTGSGDGSLRLDVVNTDGVTPIKDLVNITLGAGFNSGEVYTVDRSNPSVTSIIRAGSNPTNAASVDFTVTFSEPVTGVDNTDFTLTTSGVAGALVSGVTGSGSTRTVTVNTGSGNGTIKLNLIDDDTVVDVVNKPLGGPGAGNGNFTTGEVYTIDKTKPDVTINQAVAQSDPVTGPSATTVIHFTAVFTKPVTGFTNSDVTISGTAGATVVNISQIAPNDGTTYDVAIEGMTTSGTVIADIPANVASDSAGNLNTIGTFTDHTVTFNLDNFTTFEVNSTADTDDGQCAAIGTGNGCTLREAINAANTDAGAETITFNSTVFAAPGPYTINLTGALPNISGDVTISGPGAKVLTVARNTGGNYTIFTIAAGNTNVTLDGLTISNGNAGAGSGGGISNSSTGTVNVTNCAISGNTAGTDGGGIANGVGSLNIINSTISGNSAQQGGGFRTIGGPAIAIINSTISGNTATTNGGGIITANATLTITASTITNNRADNDTNGSGLGGGIFVSSGTTTLQNTIVAGNFNDASPSTTPDDISGTMDAGSSFNLIGNGGAGGLVNGTNSNQVGVLDPGLNPLADNGGPTKTHSLLCTSPAIDKGFSFTLTNDQRGGTRPFDFADAIFPNAVGGDGSDIGAFETQAGGGCVPEAQSPNPQPTTNEDNSVSVQLKAVYSQNVQMTFSIDTPPTNGSLGSITGTTCTFNLSTTCTANVLYTPNADYFGPDIFKFKASTNPGGLTSDPADVNVTINSVNDPPSFLLGPTQNILEDAGPQSVANFANTISVGPANETGQTYSFIVQTNTNPGLFSAGPAIDTAGTLTYTTAANANGSATITFVMKDSGGGNDTSVPRTFTIDVASVNDAPTFTKGPDISVNENAPAQTINNWATAISPGPANESAQTVTFKVTNLTNPALFSVGPLLNANGTLSFTPTPNISGSCDVTIELKDSGGIANGGVDTSASQTFTITVNNGGLLQLSSATYSVGESGGNAVITITRTGGTAGTTSVQFATSNGTATTVSDYTAVSQTVTFNDGDASKTVNIPITNDLLNEPNETVNITLSGVTGSGVLGAPSAAVLTINDDDPLGGYLKFSSANYSVAEGGIATITVQRTGTLTQAVTVDYATSDSSVGPQSSCAPTPGNTLASSRCDFTSAFGTITFGAGDGADKAFTVLIDQDSYVEGPETLSLTLSNPTSGAGLVIPSTSTLTINDDVSEPGVNLVDDTNTFVEQLYRDFLNRASDPAGKAFWVDNIDRCNDPARRLPGLTQAQCIEVQRINTAAAFFLSIEFQTTGGTAYLTNKAAFGTVPTFLNFEPDAQAIGRSYIFGQPGAEAILEANKVAYFNSFVARSSFTVLYGGLTNTQYVDTLIMNTGVSFTPAERNALINGLNNATETRATVLRKIVEKGSFRDAEFNRMFVLMEYFGFLRRDPDAAGFNFWLTKLNQFNGNYINAEMIKAFISSAEYRQRFGP